MSTIQHRDIAGEDLHPPGPHADQHGAEGDDAVTPEAIGAAAAAHAHDEAYAALGHDHDSAYAALGHDHADFAKTDGTRPFTAPVEGKQFSNALHDNVNTPAIDWANGVWQRLTLNADKTLTFANAATGRKLILVIVQDVTGSRTISWPVGTKWEDGTAPTLSTAGNAVDIVAFISDGSSYYGQVYGQHFS